MDMEISEVLEAQVADPGEITLPSATLHAIVGKSMGDVINFTLEKDRMAVTAAKSKFMLGTLAADDFPVFGMGTDDQVTVTIASEALRQLLERTRHAISSEEARYYLNGVLLHATGLDGATPLLRAVATDGHRLARADEAAVFSDASAFGNYIVPRKAVGEIRKLVDKPEGDVMLTFGANSLAVESGAVTIKTKLIDGTFPDYKRVIPKQTIWSATIQSAELREAVDRVAIIASDKSKGVKIIFGKESVKMETRGQDGDHATDEIAATCTQDIEIGFNAAYLTDIMINLKGEFRIRGTDAASPTICDTPDDPAYLQVLMPMRV